MPELITLPREPRAGENVSASFPLPIRQLTSMSTVTTEPLRWIHSGAVGRVPLRLSVVSRGDITILTEETTAGVETWKLDDDGARIARRYLASALAELRTALEAEPVEDGIRHPGAEVVRVALLGHPSATAKWIRTLVSEVASPGLASAVLKFLGRLEAPGSAVWRSDLIRSALAHHDPEVRDAAIQAVENWGERALLPVLEAHSDPLSWLQAYREKVVADIRD